MPQNCTPAVQSLLRGGVQRLPSTPLSHITIYHLLPPTPPNSTPSNTEGRSTSYTAGGGWSLTDRQLLTALYPRYYNLEGTISFHHQGNYSMLPARLNVGMRRGSSKYIVIVHKHSSDEQHSSLSGMPFTPANLSRCRILGRNQDKILKSFFSLLFTVISTEAEFLDEIQTKSEEFSSFLFTVTATALPGDSISSNSRNLLYISSNSSNLFYSSVTVHY
jgi:hypothetical protein